MAILNAIQRYLIIIRKIRQSNGITLKELQEKVIDELTAHGDTNIAVSDRTLKRDLQNIRDDLKIGINYTPSKGYHMAEDEVSQPKNIENILESFDILNALNADTGLNAVPTGVRNTSIPCSRRFGIIAWSISVIKDMKTNFL